MVCRSSLLPLFSCNASRLQLVTMCLTSESYELWEVPFRPSLQKCGLTEAMLKGMSAREPSSTWQFDSGSAISTRGVCGKAPSKTESRRVCILELAHSLFVSSRSYSPSLKVVQFSGSGSQIASCNALASHYDRTIAIQTYFSFLKLVNSNSLKSWLRPFLHVLAESWSH